MSCEKKNFTYGQGLEEHKHELLEFADIQIGRDNELCIDPARIHLLALSGDKWAIKADSMFNSYFFALFDAAKAKDYLLVEGLVKNHCGEINYTQLGMSKYEPSGNGASYRLVYPAIYQMIERGLFEKDLIVSISDIPIWTKRIGGERNECRRQGSRGVGHGREWPSGSVGGLPRAESGALFLSQGQHVGVYGRGLQPAGQLRSPEGERLRSGRGQH